MTNASLSCKILLVSDANAREAYWGRSSAGRAPALQAGGQEFDSPRLHQSLISGLTFSRTAFLCAKKDAHAYERLRKLFNGSAAFVFFPFLAVFVDVPFAVDIDIFFDSTRAPYNASFWAVVFAIIGADVDVGDKGNVIIGAVCF